MICYWNFGLLDWINPRIGSFVNLFILIRMKTFHFNISRYHRAYMQKCSKLNKKMCKGTKNVRVSQNEGPMRAKCYFLWHIMVLNFLVCLVWALWGLVWSCNSCCFLRPSAYVALCGLISLFMALYGLLWSFMAKDRLFSWS